MSDFKLPPAACDTFPKLLEHHRQARPDRPAIREKDFGVWQTYSWSQVAAEVRDLAAGLLSLGVRRGDKVAIVGDNRPRLYWTITAVPALRPEQSRVGKECVSKCRSRRSPHDLKTTMTQQHTHATYL